MLVVSPQLCSYGWVLDDPIISYEQENMSYIFRERTDQTSGSIDLHSPSSKIQLKHDDFGDNSNDGSLNGDGEKKVKKLNHNASERERRKKMNTLYANLRSLLPQDDQSKKMSIPVTISRVLKYIPELQKEVETLIQKKERLMSNFSMASANNSSFEFENHNKMKTNHQSSNSVASTVQINECEIVIQISMPKSEKGSFSEAIYRLEDEGFVMVNASCFESLDGRLFRNLHFQAQEGQVADAKKLKEKVWCGL